MSDTPAPTAPTSPGLDPKFVYSVGVLLLVIIAAMLGWAMRMQQRTALAEGQVIQLNKTINSYDQRAMSLLNASPTMQGPPIIRDRLTRTPATMDSQSVEILELPAILGKGLGLAPGDIVRVAEEPRNNR